MIKLLKQHPFFKDKKLESCTLLENQGYCNENYLLVASENKYIVRKLLRADIDRAFEWHVLRLAYEQGITAEPLVYDELNGLMVFSFLEGEHRDTLGLSDVRFLVDTLKKLHGIHVKREPIEINIQEKTDEVRQAFETIDKYPKEYVLCHNDLNPENIFFSDEAKLIDFEYAGVNDRYFDLACVCVEFKLGIEMQEIFLEIYFESAYTLEKLESYKLIYKALVDEWFENML